MEGTVRLQDSPPACCPKWKTGLPVGSSLPGSWVYSSLLLPAWCSSRAPSLLGTKSKCVHGRRTGQGTSTGSPPACSRRRGCRSSQAACRGFGPSSCMQRDSQLVKTGQAAPVTDLHAQLCAIVQLVLRQQPDFTVLQEQLVQHAPCITDCCPALRIHIQPTNQQHIRAEQQRGCHMPRCLCFTCHNVDLPMVCVPLAGDLGSAAAFWLATPKNYCSWSAGHADELLHGMVSESL